MNQSTKQKKSIAELRRIRTKLQHMGRFDLFEETEETHHCCDCGKSLTPEEQIIDRCFDCHARAEGLVDPFDIYGRDGLL